MKRKKGFTSGRSLIPCHKKWLKRLHQAVGKLLAHWSQVEIQDATFNVSDTIEAAMKIKKFGILCKERDEGSGCEIETLNRDLKGFFTSVPQPRLLSDVETVRCRVRKRYTSWSNDIMVWAVFLGKGT